ncbi:MAG TPA: serine/threonine-protein kinase [Longimicrobium sp.]|nr:serine/threonine-protein kinase [Longimicrobium sp.]
MSGILALLLGRHLCDRYRVESVIATGGMGSVCRAHDVKLERDVAVKVITAVAPDADEAGRLRARFHREATAAARLRHPNVVTVHDFGTDPALGIDFLVMEMLAGEDLAARMRRAGGPLPVDEAVEIMREAGMGLASGHRAGLVHRDVKPANIYLVAEPGGWEVKVLDFGIAQVRAQDGSETAARLTQFGVPHTPRYASPEQLAGGAVTAASDVYSLALTGLEMLSGAYPEGLNTTADDREAARRVKRMVGARGDVPLRLAAVLRRALRVDAAARFADADAFLDALDEWTQAPPADPASAAGYASIVPGAIPGPRPTAATPGRPAAALADDDRTMLATPQAAIGTMFAPPPMPPMVVPQYAPQAAAGAQPAAVPAPAQPDDGTADPVKPRRRIRLRPAGWFLLLAIVLVAVMLAVQSGTIRPGAIRSGEPNPELPVPRVTPPGGMSVGPDEFRRVTGGGEFHAGDRAFVVILASFTPEQVDDARSIRDNIRGQGYDVGVGNNEVYPELRDGYVVVVAGPYPTRTDAEAALPDLRRDGRADAFLKRVTIRKPPE